MLLSQQAYGGSVFVEPDDGSQEFYRRTLQRDDDGYFITLPDGGTVRLSGDRLYRVGWAPLGLVSLRGREIGKALVPKREVRADGGGWVDTGVQAQNYRIVRPASWNGVLVNARHFRDRLFGVAEARLSRLGREDALVEEGGQQKLSAIWIGALSLGALVMGSLMAAVTMGAIP
jgi:hypothetical protein